MRYRVKCGFRPASHPIEHSPGPWCTRFAFVEVTADSDHEARLSAIDACYSRYGDIEHVHPGTPERICYDTISHSVNYLGAN